MTITSPHLDQFPGQPCGWPVGSIFWPSGPGVGGAVPTASSRARSPAGGLSAHPLTRNAQAHARARSNGVPRRRKSVLTIGKQVRLTIDERRQVVQLCETSFRNCGWVANAQAHGLDHIFEARRTTNTGIIYELSECTSSRTVQNKRALATPIEAQVATHSTLDIRAGNETLRLRIPAINYPLPLGEPRKARPVLRIYASQTLYLGIMRIDIISLIRLRTVKMDDLCR